MQKEKWASQKWPPFSLCFYTVRTASLYHDSYEIREYANYRTGNQNKDENSGNPFFKVSIFAKEMAYIKEETNKENDTK